jgi:hypothetical protein
MKGCDDMGRITIYLDKETEGKMRAFVKSKRLSLSKWIAGLIREKLINEWPDSVVALSGAWEDFPSVEEIRAEKGHDSSREHL